MGIATCCRRRSVFGLFALLLGKHGVTSRLAAAPMRRTPPVQVMPQEQPVATAAGAAACSVNQSPGSGLIWPTGQPAVATGRRRPNWAIVAYHWRGNH
jgi:hypothetical protein